MLQVDQCQFSQFIKQILVEQFNQWELQLDLLIVRLLKDRFHNPIYSKIIKEPSHNKIIGKFLYSQRFLILKLKDSHWIKTNSPYAAHHQGIEQVAQGVDKPNHGVEQPAQRAPQVDWTTQIADV